MLCSIALLALIIGSFNAMYAQTDWTHTGTINGAVVQEIHRSIDGDLYAGALFDVYRSTDNGATWSMIFRGSTEFSDFQTAVTHDREGNSAIYIFETTDTGDALVSLDRGETWNIFELPAEVTDLESPWFEGSISGKLYVIGRTSDFEAKLLSARDNNNTFIEELSIPNASILDIVESPGGAVFLLTSIGDYRKLPDAETWEPLVGAINTHPNAGNLIATAFEELIIARGSRAFRSRDYGDTWENVSDGLEFYSNLWLSAPRSGSALLAGELESGERRLQILHCGATSWELLHTGLPLPVDYFTEAQNGDLLGPNRIGFTVTREDSHTIATRRANFSSLPILRLTGADDWLYAATFQGDLLRSSDGGASWDLTFLPLSLTGDLAVMDIIATSSGIVLAATSKGMYRSTDNGATWTFFTLDDPDLRINTFYETSEGDIFSSVRGTLAIYRSEDEGVTWSANGALPLGGAWMISENADGSIIAGSSDGIWRLEDNATWARLTPEGTSLPLVLGSRNADNIVALGEQNEMINVYRGDAQGVNWESIPISLDNAFQPLVFDFVRSLDGGALFTTFEGMFYLGTQAQQWQEADLSVELDDTDIVTGLYDAEQTTFAATIRGEVYKRDAISSAAKNRFDAPGKRMQMFPQPARNRATITFQSAEPGLVSISLYNALGAHALTIQRRIHAPGAQSFDIDTSVLAAGMYTVHISANDIITPRSLIIVR